MAIVEKVKKDEDVPKWEPFVTITLSEREAAGVAALVSQANTSIVGYQFYRDLNRALGGSNDYGDEIRITGCTRQTEVLNNRYGKL